MPYKFVATFPLRNACTELTSRDDSDICNLGSINLARIDSLEEMKKVTPRTAVWDEWAKKGETGIIYPYEEDDDDEFAKQKRAKMGIRSPKEYTSFEKVQTKFMKEAYKKKTPSDIIDQVEEEEWEQKEDDPGGVIEERRKRSRRRNQRSRRSRRKSRRFSKR